jgi:hypothetical protein
MSLLDDLGGLLNQYAAGNATSDDVHSAYDRVAPGVPQSTLADGISHAFRSDQTPAFEQMVGTLYNQSDPDQKAGVLNQILAALGPSAAPMLGGLGGSGALAGIGDLLSGRAVSPQQAQEIPPQTVEVLAQQAAKKDPTIMDQAASFYAQHPTLVKAIGAGALALLLSKMSRR